MKISSKMLAEISNITRRIETDYPELYKYLDENPLTIPNEANPNVDDASLKEYLETLKSMLKKYKDDRK